MHNTLFGILESNNSLHASHPNGPESLIKTYTEEKYEEQVEE